jgi:hypothetical protein
MTEIDNAVANVLSSKRLLLSHPNAAKFNQLYATSDKGTTNLAESVNSSGRNRVSSNSLAVGGRSDFQVSSSSVVYDLILQFEIPAVPADGKLMSGWGFNAISSIEITYSNSLIQNLVITGPCLKEYLLLSCSSKDQRDELIRNAGLCADAAAANQKASIPIPLLNQNASGVYGNYGLDFAVMNGPLTVSVIWNQSGQFIARKATGTAAGTLANFANVNLSMRTSDLQDGAFSVKRALNMNPELVYSVPSRYINCIPYTVTANAYASGIATIPAVNLNSVPAGQLEYIILSLIPQQMYQNAAGTESSRAPVSQPDFESIRLTYGGQTLYEANTYQEICNRDLMMFGDSLLYNEPYSVDAAATAAQAKKSKVYCIPMTYEARKVISSHCVENLPSYSGATLVLEMSIKTATSVAGNSSFAEGGFAAAYPTDASTYRLNIAYVLTSLLEVSNGTVDLQL